MEKEFIAYEYKEVIINKKRLDLYLDCVINLGWEVTNKENHLGKIKLHLKRNYKINNREEVLKLEKDFEEKFNLLEKINNEKYDLGLMISLTVGLIGTACLAGATFSFLASKIALMIILAIPGFVGWFLPYFINKKINNKNLVKVEQKNTELKNEIYSSMEKAFSLLNK